MESQATIMNKELFKMDYTNRLNSLNISGGQNFSKSRYLLKLVLDFNFAF